jgi:dihydroorotate dehydrogenase (NAD+) catalytic subunit
VGDDGLVRLQVELAPRHKTGLLLKNPVMTAAGTFGYGVELARLAEVQRLGAVICKGTTLRARTRNAPPQMLEVASGLVNTIGLQNLGARVVAEKYAPIWASWETPAIVNVAGTSIDEYVGVVEYLEGVAGIAGIELNVSCLDVQQGGITVGVSPQVIADVTIAVRNATTLPLIVKLSPNTGDLRPAALAAASAGADAVSLINTLTAISIDIHTRRLRFDNELSGFSGPAIKPIALRMVYEVASELRSSHPDIPVIGVGGISSTQDALEFLMAGASAIQVGTMNFVNPRICVEIVEGIEAFLRQEGIKDVRAIVGAAL